MNVKKESVVCGAVLALGMSAAQAGGDAKLLDMLLANEIGRAHV